MAGKADWAEAFFAQASEDLAAAKKLEGETPSVLAMLLQMTFEKMAKAALLRSGQATIEQVCRSHAAASRMLAVMKRNRSMLRTLGNGYEYAWKDVLPVVTELERAHPQLAGRGPQLEYPWEEADSGGIRWPARDLPIAQRLAAPGSMLGSRVMKFAAQLEQQFDQVFPP